MNYNPSNKEANVSQLNAYMLAKTLSMFSYEGLPSTIPAKALEKLLQRNGYAFIAEHNGSLCALWGGLGGVPDEYGEPTQINVSNPALGINKTYDLAEGVLIKNDDMALGLMPIMQQYHGLMVENQLTMDMLSFNSRTTTILSASDDKTKASAEAFMKKIKEGEVSIIGENAFFEGVKSHTTSTTGGTKITELIEYHQFLKSSLLSEAGINAPFNMKRERVNSGEVNQHEESLSIFVDNMKENREEALFKVSDLFNVDIICDFAGVWKRKRGNEEKEAE